MDRERLALDAVQKALRLDPPEVADLRRRHSIGADAVDQFRQFYEIKMESSGDFPSYEATVSGVPRWRRSSTGSGRWNWRVVAALVYSMWELANGR